MNLSINLNYEFEKEKAKIEKLRHSFAMMTKLINRELINSFNRIEFLKSHLDDKLVIFIKEALKTG